MSIHVTIDGKGYLVQGQKSILDVCKEEGIYTPTLCHDERLEPYSGCRLCLVEIKDMPKPLAACTTPAQDGMAVVTESDNLTDLRRMGLSRILSNHPNDCMCCEQAGDCALQELAYRYDVRPVGTGEEDS